MSSWLAWGIFAIPEKRDHDKLVAELRFRLPAVEVRAPPILPGGTAPTPHTILAGCI